MTRPAARRPTAALLLVAAVLTNGAFSVLGSVFDYPDVLRQPPAEVLVAFRASQATIVFWFAVLALSAALLVPIALGVGRLSTSRTMRVAVGVGIAAAAVQVVGLARWPLLVPGYAARAASPDPVVAAHALGAFATANRVLGTFVGETLGYLLTAAWTLLVLAALGRRLAGAWFTALGAVSAVLVAAGALSPLHVPLVDTANFVGYVAWSVWLVAFAVLLLRQARVLAPRPGLPRRADLSPHDPATPAAARPQGFVSSWLLWTVGFVSFPVAGVVALLVVERVDTPVTALVGGALTGAVIGAGQWLVSRHRVRPVRWIAASTGGMGLGLLLGATVVGFGTSLGDLALMGALSGAALGVGQALALPARMRRRWWWAAAIPVLWSLGWVVSTAIGVTVEDQFSIFGASGAVVVSALSGLLLAWVLPRAATVLSPTTGRRTT